MAFEEGPEGVPKGTILEKYDHKTKLGLHNQKQKLHL